MNSKGFSGLHMDTKDFIGFPVISKDALDIHYALDVLGSRFIKINEKLPPGFKELSWWRWIMETVKIFVEHFECVCY